MEKRGWREGRNDNLKGPISSMRFFILPVLTTFASDITTVINIISEMTTITSSCKSRTHKKKDTTCLCSYSPAFLKQTPKTKQIFWNKYLENVFLKWLNYSLKIFSDFSVYILYCILYSLLRHVTCKKSWKSRDWTTTKSRAASLYEILVWVKFLWLEQHFNWNMILPKKTIPFDLESKT